jgi:hypothetical protein
MLERTFDLRPGRSSLSFSVQDSLEGESLGLRKGGREDLGYGMTFNLGF